MALRGKALLDITETWQGKVRTAFKTRPLCTTTLAVATYGAELRAMKNYDRKRVDAFELWCYRPLLRVSWKERKTNAWPQEKMGSDITLRQSIAQRHFCQMMRHTSLERGIIQREAEEQQGRGREQIGWMASRRRRTALSLGLQGMPAIAANGAHSIRPHQHEYALCE